MRHSKGYRTRMRKLLRKHPRRRGLPGLSSLMYKYNIGDRVHIKINPNFITTAPHRRYHGKTGVIIGQRGRAYLVEVYIGKKRKIIITTPEHLMPAAPAKPAEQAQQSGGS